MTTSDQLSIASRYGGPAERALQLETFKNLERTTFDYSPIEVEFLKPDIALVTFEKSYKGTFDGTALPARVIVGEIWLKQGEAWLQRFYQETPVAN